MKLNYRIFLYSSNHITGNLVRLKLKSFGNDVALSECQDEAIKILNTSDFDLLVLNDPNKESPIVFHAENKQIPVLFIDTGKDTNSVEAEKCSMGLSFSEEEFHHKISFLAEFKEDDKKLSVLDSVISHYGGDKELAQKVVGSFLEGWLEAIDKIFHSFENDNDRELARKIHSFKGVLSALGETEAAALIRKMEILVKARNRDLALKMYPELKNICNNFAAELESSTLLNS